MALSDRETVELLGRIGSAFLCMFTEEARARTPEFEQEIQDHLAKIAADSTTISGLESSTKPVDCYEALLLKLRIDAHWKEIVLAIEERGSIADRKSLQFMALIFPSFDTLGIPSLQDPDTKMLIDLHAFLWDWPPPWLNP